MLILILVANLLAVMYWAIGKSAPIFTSRFSLFTLVTFTTLIAMVAWTVVALLR